MHSGLAPSAPEEIMREPCQYVEHLGQISRRLPQDNLIAAAENLHLVHFQTKLPGDPDRLRIPASKDLRDRHTMSISSHLYLAATG